MILNKLIKCLKNTILRKKQIRIKYLNPNLEKIKKITIGDWIDLRSAEDVTLKKGDLHYIKLGVCIQLPKGYEGWLTSRSSMAKRYGIIHSDDLGVIDNSYCGDNDEWHLPVYAIRDTTIHVNDRICQFRIHKTMEKLDVVEVERMGNPDRGGLGSTGRN